MIRLLFVLLLITPQAYAANYEAAQGDVLRIPAPIQGDNLSVRAFDKTWPIFEKDGQKIAWIGVRLKTKPATYDIQWLAGGAASVSQATDTVQINKGDFRISRITVEKKLP